MEKILVVEDEPSLLLGLERTLKEEGYRVFSAKDGDSGFKLAKSGMPDLILLDVMLPKLNGFELCKRLREEGSRIPIIFLTAKSEEVDRIVGLQFGGDDYITKPFSLKELLLRIKAVLKRSKGERTPVDRYLFDDVVVDLKNHEVKKKDKVVDITPREFKVLQFLIEHKGEVISREVLLDYVWGYDEFPTTRTVDNHILTLRKKLEKNWKLPEHFLTVHKIGYKFI